MLLGSCLVESEFACRVIRKGELDVRCRVRLEGRVGGGGEGLRLEVGGWRSEKCRRRHFA
jgi:hypothetical protein